MIAVVTGGSGFIGRNLVERLLRDGHTVRCLVRPGGRAAPEGTESHRVSFTDATAVSRCAALDGADAVFHLAAATRAVRKRDFHAANVVPTANIAAALASRGAKTRLVFMSSQAAAGPAVAVDQPRTEFDEPRPVEAYGRSKLAAEREVTRHSDRLESVILRPAAVFGPHDRDFLTLFRMAAAGVVLYPGVATHWLSLVSVREVVSACVSAASVPAAAGTYFVARRAPVTWRALGDDIALAVGRSVVHIDVPRPLISAVAVAGEFLGRATGHVPLATRAKADLARSPYWVCSGERAQAVFGARDDRSLPEAIVETYLWYVQHGWLRSPSAA